MSQFYYGMYQGQVLQKAIENFEKVQTKDFYTWKFEQKVISTLVKHVQDFEKEKPEKNGGLVQQVIDIDATGAKFAKCSSAFTKVVLGSSRTIEYANCAEKEISVNAAGFLVLSILSGDFGTNESLYGKLAYIVNDAGKKFAEIDLSKDEKELGETMIKITFPEIKDEEVGDIEGDNALMATIAFLTEAGKKVEKESTAEVVEG